jgi:hypothetical protein
MPRRIVTYQIGLQQEPQTMTIWLGCTSHPLTWEEWKGFLFWCEGFFKINIWSTLQFWELCNQEMAIDGYAIGETIRVTMRYFTGTFAQFYQKERQFMQLAGVTYDLYRAEVRNQQQMAIETWMEIWKGSVDTNRILQLVVMQNNKIDQLQKLIYKILRERL